MLLLTLALTGCGDETDKDSSEPADSSEVSCESAPDLTWSNWGDGFFANYCRACHSESVGDRWGAPEGLDFDTLEQVQQNRGWIHQTVLVDGTMPVGGGVYEEDLEFLTYFLECSL